MLISKREITLSPRDDLNTAMEKFSLKDLEELPVVDTRYHDRVIGMLKRKDALAAYKKAVARSSEGA